MNLLSYLQYKMFLLNKNTAADLPRLAEFTIQNVPIKSLIDSNMEINEMYLQYKMFLLNL